LRLKSHGQLRVQGGFGALRAFSLDTFFFAREKESIN
jgi:hypothetical protein